MRPQEDRTDRHDDAAPPSENGVGGAAGGEPDGGESDGEEDGEGGGEEAWLCVEEPERVVEALRALNALRKSRQYYDVVLVAGGAEVPAHRAVLAAASPHLLEALRAPAAAVPATYRVDAEPDALRALVEYAYTGRLRLRGEQRALDLYRAAWRLRVESVRARAADHLLRRLAPHSCLRVRALPDLAPHHLRALDHYIATNFRALCETPALATLPTVRLEVLREAGAWPVGDAAGAALLYLQEQLRGAALEDVCARRHVVFVDGGGALRDCGALPATRGDAPELTEYRREAAARPPPRAPPPRALEPHAPLLSHRVGARTPAPRWSVLAAAALADSALLALADARDSLVRVSVAWRSAWSPLAGSAAPPPFSPGGSDGARSDDSSGADDDARLAPLARGRCAHGLAVWRERLVVCGGYDRAEVLRSVEAYDAARNVWRALPELRTPRARFSLARLRDELYAVGGSDGHSDLDTVEVYRERDGEGAWARCARLPQALSQGAACADEGAGLVYCVGGAGAGAGLREVHAYCPREDRWSRAPSLRVARSSCCAVWWGAGGGVWVLGGCDAWHCLASTERLAGDEWEAGPPLPTARRSVAGAVWRGALVALGGADGAASLRRVEWLPPGGDEWRAGPPMREPRAALAAGVLHDVLYAVGGFCGKRFLSSLECLPSLEGEWTRLLDARSPPALPPLIHHQTEQEELQNAQRAPPPAHTLH